VLIIFSFAHNQPPQGRIESVSAWLGYYPSFVYTYRFVVSHLRVTTHKFGD